MRALNLPSEIATGATLIDMAPRHRSQPPEDDEEFAGLVDDIEGARAKRKTFFEPGSMVFRGTAVMAILTTVIGGVWGVAISFSSFQERQKTMADGQKNTREDVDKLRDEVGRLRRTVLLVREGDLWAEAIVAANGGKIVVPKPSAYKVDN